MKRIEKVIRALRIRPTTGRRKERLEHILAVYDQWRQSQITAQRARRMVYTWTARLAIAAMITVVLTLAVLHVSPNKSTPEPIQTGKMSSPVDIMTEGSLQTAFRQGGLEGVERQLDRAAKLYGPWPSNLNNLDLL